MDARSSVAVDSIVEAYNRNPSFVLASSFGYAPAAAAVQVDELCCCIKRLQLFLSAHGWFMPVQLLGPASGAI